MTIEELIETIADYNLCIDRLPEGWDEDDFDNDAPVPIYKYKDGTEWESYSTLADDKDDPDYGEYWDFVFCSNDHYGEDGYDFRVEYEQLEDESCVAEREKAAELVANELVKMLTEAGYSLDDFELDYIS